MAVSAEVATLFLEELARRHVAVVPNEEGGYVLAIPVTITKTSKDAVDVQVRTVTVHLDNLSRDYAADPDPARITHFVDACTKEVQLPNWEETEPGIRWQAEAAGTEFGATLIEAVSDKVVRALVHVDPTEMHIAWLGPDHVARWGKTAEEVWAVAARNMARILSETKLDLTEDRGHKVGMLATKLTGFKAALLFSPASRPSWRRSWAGQSLPWPRAATSST